jgi:uncharacterized damage-inducible protein DinB
MNKNEIIARINKTCENLMNLIISFSQEEINITPFENSWTAAQVISHITRSNRSITQALSMEATAAARRPDARVEELKEIFLDFNTKLKSPDFILPDKDIYNKEKLVENLQQSIDQLLAESAKVNLSGAIQHPAFGDITKLELLHFVLYHTLRHIRQLKNIFQLVENN